MKTAPPVRIEAENEWAWCGERRLDLTPRAFSVLRHLVANSGRLVTKDDLFSAVWRDTIVSDAALASCIRDLRRALEEDSRAPRYIQTVHRRGFRFIGPAFAEATAGKPSESASASAKATADRPAARPEPAATFVGREAELARLQQCLEDALDRQRRVVFIAGEPGIGKTTLVNAFLATIAETAAPRLGRGQCIEQYGAGEAYLPVLEALGRMGRDPRDPRLVQTLTQYAPSWLAQLPALLTDSDLESVHRRSLGATRDRMLRELVEALEALSADAPVVLVLEDLHWSDASTIDLLSMVARRREPARLLVIGTFRPADVAASSHPLGSARQELLLHGHCEELLLEFLDAADVSEYLTRRFGLHAFPPELPAALHRHTDGNPLFLVNTVDDLVSRSHIVEGEGRWVLSVSVDAIALEEPGTLLQMVGKQIERLSADEQAVLTVAAVAGVEFSAAIGAADGIDADRSDRVCEKLAKRGQLLRPAGTIVQWPDGTVASGYAFVHASYQRAIYTGTSIGRRVGLHLRIAERLERAYGAHAGDIASKLAVHFEEGRDLGRAAGYRSRACEQALRQCAYREAAEHAARGLELLKSASANATDDPQAGARQELTLNVMLGSAFTALRGHAAREVEQAYARARELCERVDEAPRVFPALLGLGSFYAMRGPSDAAHDVGRRLSKMAGATGEAGVGLAAHTLLGMADFYSGEFAAALEHFDQGRALYDPGAHSPPRSAVFRNGFDLGVTCTVYGACALWILGQENRAEARMQEGLAQVSAIDHPFSRAHAHRFAAAFHQGRGELALAGDCTEVSLALAAEHGFVPVTRAAGFHRGWLEVQRGLGQEGRQQGIEDGMKLMHAWMTFCRDTRADAMIPPYAASLAETMGELGHRGEALALVDEGLAVAGRSGYHYATAELHRVKAALSETSEAAEACLHEALAVARRQGAKTFELRAAAALAQLDKGRGGASVRRSPHERKPGR